MNLFIQTFRSLFSFNFILSYAGDDTDLVASVLKLNVLLLHPSARMEFMSNKLHIDQRKEKQEDARKQAISLHRFFRALWYLLITLISIILFICYYLHCYYYGFFRVIIIKPFRIIVTLSLYHLQYILSVIFTTIYPVQSQHSCHFYFISF